MSISFDVLFVLALVLALGLGFIIASFIPRELDDWPAAVLVAMGTVGVCVLVFLVYIGMGGTQ